MSCCRERVHGGQLAEKARAMLPDLRVLFTSGLHPQRAGPARAVDPSVQLLGKPYRLVELAGEPAHRRWRPECAMRGRLNSPHPCIRSYPTFPKIARRRSGVRALQPLFFSRCPRADRRNIIIEYISPVDLRNPPQGEPLLSGLMEKLTVLILADDAEIRRLLSEAMEMDGHEPVQGCACIEDMRKVDAEHDVGLYLIDITLPDGDGLEVARTLRLRSDPAARPDHRSRRRDRHGAGPGAWRRTVTS